MDAVDEELEAAEDACRTEPFDPEVHGRRARALLAVGRHGDALAAARIAVSLVDATAGAAHPEKSAGAPSTDPARRRDVLTLATAVAMAVDAPTQAIEWAELLRGDGGESAVADPVGPPDPNEPVTHAKVIAQSVAPPLVVGTRVVSLIEQADVDRRRLHDHASQESVGRRPTKVVRDARGAPVGLDTPGGLIVDGTREVPSQTFSKWGLLVFGVLFVVLLAWLCSGPSTRPGGPGGSTPCTVSALDLRGEPVTVDC